MRQIQFLVRSQTLYYHKREPVRAYSQDYLYAKFTFTDDWSNTKRYAKFTRGYPSIVQEIDDAGMCVVPWEVLVGEGEFSVTLFATNKPDDPNQFITTNKVVVTIDESGITETEHPDDPTTGILGDIVKNALLAIKTQEAESVKAVDDKGVEHLSALDTALEEAVLALNTIKAEVDALKKAAQTSATNAATSETNAKASETAAANSASQALASKNAAATSESNALASQKAAAQSEANTKTSEQNALDSQKAAANSAAEAETSNQAAQGWASNANASAMNAATSASASQTNADTAVAAANVANEKADAAAESEAKAKEYAEAASEITQSQGTIYADSEGYLNILEVSA